MAAKGKDVEYEEKMDEAEEEALLQSDDEYEVAPLKESIKNLQNINENSEDADSVDSDSDLDDSVKSLQEYRKVLKELESNQYAYDKYLRLCELSHVTDELENIRSAYQLFASMYPLSQELWLKYLKIEMNVALSNKEIDNVQDLFKRALADYYSTEIAMEYANLAERTATPERIWQEILGTYGLHCMKGQNFYKRYRQFLANQDNRSAEDKQNAFVQSFLRELRYPLNNMEESYIEFKVFYEKNKSQIVCDVDWEIIDKHYFKAKEHLQKILPFEKQLCGMDQKSYRERFEVYENYIKKSDKFLDENVLQTIYERMVADCCLNVDCWLTYIEFIEYRDEFGRPEELQDFPVFQQDAIDINKRALRNCTWSETLYIKRMNLLEKQQKTREEIQEVLESSMSAGFQTAEPAVAIWLEYLTFLRRHTNWQNEGECEILRKNFDLAWTILGQQWGVLADLNCEILKFWGRLEYGPLQDAKRGKELWTTVMESSDNASKSGLWIEFANMEMQRDLDSTRKLFRKALHSTGLDNPFVITTAWERFERCNGTMKSLTTCIKESREFLLHYQQQIIRSDSNNTRSSVKGTKRKLSSSTTEVHALEKKRKQENPIKGKTTPNNLSSERKKQVVETSFKQHENQEIDLTKDHLRIFLSNLDYNLTEDEICDLLPELKIVNITLIRSVNGKSRGFGYLELENESEVKKALAMDKCTLKGRPLYVSSVLRDKEKRQKFKYFDGVEPQKLFIKGLPHDANKKELEEIFEEFGKLKDVRLIYHKSGKFKNIAYVEYEEANAASKAVMSTDQIEMRGHRITVAISAPPPKVNEQPMSSKLLGITAKRNKVFDQKPRMSLIPNIVRKKLNTATSPAITLLTDNNSKINGSVTAASTSTTQKTNEDFRKLLQNSK